MTSDQPQNYRNHRKFVPTYHYLVPPILLLNLGWTLYQLMVGFSMATLVPALVALALLFMFAHLRLFPLKVQDRVIRLEERLRLERLLGHEDRHRVAELTVDQLIGLRFASDAEVAELTLAVLEEKLNDRDAIKRRVSDWRPDHARA